MCWPGAEIFREVFPSCCILPGLMTAMLSAIARASLWSWVTNTVVSQLALQPLEEGARLEPEPRVEVRQTARRTGTRRAGRDGAGQSDALLLAAGELARPPVHQSPEPGPAPVVAAFARGPPGHLLDPQRVGDVVGDGHVREQGVVLEHHGDVRSPGDRS